MSTTYTHRLLMIVTAADQERANAAAVDIGGNPADAETFTIGHNASGSPDDTATHYWAALACDDDYFARIHGQWVPLFPGATCLDWDMDADPGLPDRTLSALGLQRIQPAEL